MSSTDLEVGETPERFKSDAQQSKDDASKPSDHRLDVGMHQREEAEIAYAAHLNAISEINRKGSPLLRLPAELRHRIFTYALSDRVLVRPAISSAIHNGSASSMHNLPLVCRQLYHETHLLVYRLGLFDIKKPRWFAEFISGGEQAKKSIIEVRISSSDLYLMAQTTYEFVADMFAPHFEVFNYRRCAAGFHDLANLQRVVVTPSLVLYSRTVDHFLRCQEVNHPDQVAWAVQQITGREDVEILLTYSHSDEDYMDSSDEEDSDRLCFELLGF